MGTGQPAVHFHTVVASKIVIDTAFQCAFRSGGIRFRRQIHLNFIAAAEGDVAASFEFPLLVKCGPCIHGNLIGRGNRIITVYEYIFSYATALTFRLIVHVNICIGIVNLPFDGSHFGIFSNVHIGFTGHDLL